MPAFNEVIQKREQLAGNNKPRDSSDLYELSFKGSNSKSLTS